MQLTGDNAEVAECCAEWRFKSKLNYAFHKLGNSMPQGGEPGSLLAGALLNEPRSPRRLETLFEIRFRGRSGNILLLINRK